MPDFTLPLLVITILSGISGFFIYLFLFRLPSSQIDPNQQAILDALSNDDANVERITIVLYSQLPSRDQLRSQLLVVSEFEPINLRRQTPQHDYRYYASLDASEILECQRWDVTDYETLRTEITTALHQCIDNYAGQGWQITLQIPFSDVDHMVYLQRPRIIRA